jgi:hypothetical protein
MRKVPVDLRCLDNCTAVNFPETYVDHAVNSSSPITLDCSNSRYDSFLNCYLFNRPNHYLFVSENYFELAVESCLLALTTGKLLYEENCEDLGVNLRIFNPLLPYPHLSNSTSFQTRLVGPSTGDVSASLGVYIKRVDPLKNRYPWVCSLRTAGFNGLHRCGVTLLSGPPQKTIFVSAAHCNYVCKNAGGQVVEICCCKYGQSPFSCPKSDFCGVDPKLTLAKPGDLQIACNLTNLDVVPKGVSPLDTILLNIREIKIHEKYDPKTGPVGGYDISVYIVDDTDLTMNKDYVWPACLPQPQNSYLPGNRGIIAGWNQPLPTYIYSPDKSIGDYQDANLREREALFEAVKCSDPDWMESNTYYPPGTVCYADVAFASSVQFGISGSGIVRPFLFEKQTNIRYSWAGALSFSKGADYPVVLDDLSQKLYSGNPSVFTDAQCYMDWIAAQYGLILPEGYTVPSSCSHRQEAKKIRKERTADLEHSYQILARLPIATLLMAKGNAFCTPYLHLI